jgi:hemerythrin-like domain-containing protein
VARHTARVIIEPITVLYDSHRQTGQFLAKIADVVQQTNGGVLTPAQWYELAVSIIYFETAWATHTADEEESIYLRLQASAAGRSARQRILDLKREHREAHRHIRIVDALVRRWLVGSRLDKVDIRGLRKSLTAIEAIYSHHFAIEDKEIFPLAERVFTTHAMRRIGQEMVARRTGGEHPQRP